MERITKINENIHRLTIPYKDIYTTVYTVRTDKGILLFDSASFDEDIEESIIPFLNEIGIDSKMLKYVFISHNHKDHAGGLESLMKRYPEICIITRSLSLKEKFSDYNVIMPDDGDVILDVLQIVTIPGHTPDSSAIFDTRTKMLISGDSLQLYGIYGSGKWGSNISLPSEHIDAIAKLKKMEIDHILTAHDYHPYGHSYEGNDIVGKALDACVEPLYIIKNLILENTKLNDEQICSLYNESNNPTLGEHVVKAVREMSLR